MTFSSPQYKKISVLNKHILTLTTGNTSTGQYERVKNYGKVKLVSYCDADVDVLVYSSPDSDGTVSKYNTFFLGKSMEVSVPLKAEYIKINISATFGNANGVIDVIFERSATMIKPDNNNHDLFGRLQISDSFTLFKSNMYTNNGAGFDQLLTGTGQVIYNSGFPHEFLKVSASGDKVIKQSHFYIPYIPGKAMTIMASGTLVTNINATNVRSRIGIFDDLNDKVKDTVKTGSGFYFEFLDGSVSVGYRTSMSESETPTLSQVDTIIDQSQWNLDKMDGTGDSGIIVDFAKRNIFVITYQWLGVGSAMFGIAYNNKTIWCHEMNFEGGLYGTNPTVAHISRGSLPIRYEIEAVSTIAGPETMIKICSTGLSDGGFQVMGTSHSYGMTVSQTCIKNAQTPLIAIRLGNSKLRCTLLLKGIKLLCTSIGNIIYSIYIFGDYTKYGSGLFSGSDTTWVDSSSYPGLGDSGTEINTNATSIDLSGTYPFTLIERGYFADNTNSATSKMIDGTRLGSDIKGNSDLVVVVVEPIAKNESILATIDWYEYE